MNRTIKLTIWGELPDLNHAIAQAMIPSKGKGGKQLTRRLKNGKTVPIYGIAYKNMKERADDKVQLAAKIQLRDLVIAGNCAVCIIFYCKDRRKDPPNIDHAKKYIFDGLQAIDILPNDGWKNLSGGFLELFQVDKENPRIEVYFMEGKRFNIPNFQNLIEWQPQQRKKSGGR